MCLCTYAKKLDVILKNYPFQIYLERRNIYII